MSQLRWHRWHRVSAELAEQLAGSQQMAWLLLLPCAPLSPCTDCATSQTLQISHLRSERDVLKGVDHPLIVRMCGCCQVRWPGIHHLSSRGGCCYCSLSLLLEWA